jgi:predicted regulator of Ras-like GTPase activity (Roadblock/LC7/MglB family)
MMGFHETLEKVVRGTPGCAGGLIMALDGIVVETYAAPDADVDVSLFGAEIAAILAQLRGKGAIHLSSGRVEGIDLRASNFDALIRFLSDEYFVALAVKPGVGVAKGRHLLRTAMPDLVAEL